MDRRRVRAGAVVVHEGALLCVRLRDPGTKIVHPFVPGGGLEPGESFAAAAEREALEESGYAVRVDRAACVVANYDYPWDGIVYACETHFFRGHLVDGTAAPSQVSDAVYNEGVLWIPIGRVAEELAFHRGICEAVVSLL